MLAATLAICVLGLIEGAYYTLASGRETEPLDADAELRQ
jgi:hypothetical protein